MGWMNREPAEPELPSDLNDALTGLRQKAQRCPTPELLQAAQADVLPDDQREDIVRHLENCPACKALSSDLQTLDDEPLGKAAQQRIWATIQSGIQVEPAVKNRRAFARGWNLWLRPMPLAVTASVIILFAIGALWLRNQRQTASNVAQNHAVVPPTIATASVLQLEKAPVVLPPAAVIVWRGQEDSGTRQANALKQALLPYEKDDYAEAVRRLQPLHRQYPKMAEASFYLGVCQLFLDQNEFAAASLNDAAKIAKPPLADQVSWYRALADHRVGKEDLAGSLLSDLCKAGGKDSARACAGAKELATPH